ncbi:MAG: hypothetical protein R3B09_10445 [Nannocystaceae bacterium]
MATPRTYRLNASSEQLMQRLDEVVRGRRVERVGKDEQLQLVPDGDGDGFKILLGSGEPDDPAAYVQGKLSEHAGQVLLEVQPGLVGIRPDGTRAASRELLEWALAVGGFLAIVLIAGRLTGSTRSPRSAAGSRSTSGSSPTASPVARSGGGAIGRSS